MFTLKSGKGLGSHLKFSVYEVKAKKLLVKNEAKEIALKVFLYIRPESWFELEILSCEPQHKFFFRRWYFVV